MTMSTSTPTRQGRGFVISGGAVNLDALVPASLAARAARVSKQLFNYWRKTGKVKPVATGPDGRPRYRLGDVLDAERTTRHSPQSHRAA